MARFVPHRPGPAGVRHPAVDRYWTPTLFDDVVSASVPLTGTATEAATRSDSPTGTIPVTGTSTELAARRTPSPARSQSRARSLRPRPIRMRSPAPSRSRARARRRRPTATPPAARSRSPEPRPRARPTATARAAPPAFTGTSSDARSAADTPIGNRPAHRLRNRVEDLHGRADRLGSPHRKHHRVQGPLVHRRSERHGPGHRLEHGRPHRNRRAYRLRSGNRQPDRGADVQRLDHGHHPAFGDSVRRPLRVRCAVGQRSGHRLASGLAQDPGRTLWDRPAVRHARRVLHTAADRLHRRGERNRQPRRHARRCKNRPRQPGRADPALRFVGEQIARYDLVSGTITVSGGLLFLTALEGEGSLSHLSEGALDGLSAEAASESHSSASGGQASSGPEPDQDVSSGEGRAVVTTR
jgi:hypothetical protein